MGWKQIVCITTLALLVGQSESSSNPTKPTTTPTPPINHIYNCSMDGTITIKTTGAMAKSPRIAIGQDRNESSVLKIGTADQDSCQFAGSGLNTSDIVLTNCDTSLPIYVYLMNQTSSNIVGGKNNHAYELNCYFPEGGIQRVVTAKPISVNQTNAYSHETHAFDLGNIDLIMTITPQTSHLGEKLNLTIIETQKDLYVLPMNCSATEGNGNTEYEELLTNGKAVDVNLLENFVIADKGSAVAAMYAFRFQSSEVVRVTCTVTICQTKDCGGAYTTTTTTTTMPAATVSQSPGRRRRRSVEKATPGRTYDVSAAFKILDNDPNESSSSSTSVRVNPLLTGLALLCLWAGASRKTY